MEKVELNKIFSEKGRKVSGVYNFDRNNFLVEAPDPKVNGVDYSNPFFLVNKKSKEVTNFSPVMDLDGYTRAMRNPV